MSDQKEVRIGMVGMGGRGRGLHFAWSKVEGYRLTAICDAVPRLLEKAAQHIGDPEVKCYTDFDEMLRDAPIDAVAVTTGLDAIPSLACRAMEAGKHVITEVPAAGTIQECWDLVLTVERTGMKYLFGEQTRHWGFVDAWRKMVAEGQLGHIVYAGGEYLGYYGTSFYWWDPETGEHFDVEHARDNPRAKPTWRHKIHPIVYLPHELSPLLSILNDRVVRVSAMGTRSQSYYHPEVQRSDIEVALMHTAKDTVMRLACGFSRPVPAHEHHWYQLIGSKGEVQWRRSPHEKPRFWLADHQMHDWAFADWRPERTDAPSAARGTGHGEADYWPMKNFVDCVLHDAPSEMDVYQAVETAAPAILAAQSVEEDGVAFDVPDFRPGPDRAAGEPLE